LSHGDHQVAGPVQPEGPARRQNCVALYSVTTAGPEYLLPMGITSRSYTEVSNFLPSNKTGAFLRFCFCAACAFRADRGEIFAWDVLIFARSRSITNSNSRS